MKSNESIKLSKNETITLENQNKILNIWGLEATSGDPLPDGNLLSSYIDREKYVECRIRVKNRKKEIRSQRHLRCFDLNKSWLSIGCSNPNCKYHNNGFLAVDELKHQYPETINLSESEQYELAIRIFEWNHIDRSKKTDNISNIMWEWMRTELPEPKEKWWNKLQTELENCEQMCVTCHRFETHINRHHFASLEIYHSYDDLMEQKWGDDPAFSRDKLEEWNKLNDKLCGKYDENQDLMRIFNLID